MPRKVLIVDDNSVDREILGNILCSEYEIIEAESVAEMISVLRQKAPSISAILLDLVMPDTDGYEALRRIRENAIYRQIPVIVTTSMTDEDSQVRALALGAHGYAFKPYNEKLLLHMLENTISLHEKSALANALRTDALTGLLNRNAFFKEADSMIKQKDPGYYMLSSFDIEGFKVINDQYGVKKGDEVLRHIATCIRCEISAMGGICCRFSADKFGALYPAEYKDTESVKVLYDKITNTENKGRSIRVRIGRYLVDDFSIPTSAMFDRATMAEESIRGRYDVYICEYTDSMRAHLLGEQKIVNEMEQALADGEFEAWYQPQYNHATGALIGAEALVRWKREDRMISPADFIPVFERNGFIYKMDQYIWEQVCRHQREWLDRGIQPMPVSINISRRDLFHKHFISVLTGIIDKYKLPYELIRLEVTESAFAESSGVIIAKVNELIKIGFVVEIDDFGSGYSSLNTLKDVPASILKLDMKFFERTDNNQRSGNITESIIRMAKWLGMAVIAEGVEDKAQADYLKSIGCYYIQGYYYSKPVCTADYEQKLINCKRETSLTRLKTLDTLDNNEFWNPQSMETLIFNSYIGDACIFEYHNGTTEMLRVNAQYEQEIAHFITANALSKAASPINFLDKENKAKLFDTINTVIKTHKESSCELIMKVYETKPETTLYYRATMRVIASAAERYLIYCVILNMTEQRVAEQKRNEAELRELESAKQLKVILGNINGGVSALRINDDGTSKFVFTNKKYYDLYGYSEDEVKATNLDIMSTIFPEDFTIVLSKIHKLKQDRQSTVIDYRIKRRDGRTAYLRANCSLMSMLGYDDVITAVVTDITETQQLQEQLHTLVNNISGGVTAIVVSNDKHKYMVINDQAARILGYENREKYLSTNPTQYTGIHPDDLERVRQQLESITPSNPQLTIEYRIVRLDGEVRYLLNNINTVSIVSFDKPVLLSIVNDITELKHAQQSEREAADKLSTVLNHAGGGITAIIIEHGKAKFLFSNDEYYRLIGYSREDYAKKTENDPYSIIYPADRTKVFEQLPKFDSSNDSRTLEFRVKKGDGTIAWFKASLTMTHISGIESEVQIGVFTDITDEKNTNDMLRFLNASAHDILSQPDSERGIETTLNSMLRYFDSDRAYVIEMNYDKSICTNTYEVCADGIVPQKDFLQAVPFSYADYWFELLNDKKFVVIHDVCKLEPDKAKLRALLEEQSITSLIVVPLLHGDTLVGFAGVDNPRQAIDNLEKLNALADYISVLMTRRDLTARIELDNSTMQHLMNDTPGGFICFEVFEDKNPIIASVNDGLCNMVGMTHDEVMRDYADDPFMLLLEDDVPTALAATVEAKKINGQFSTKCRLHTKCGELLETFVFGRFVLDTKGRRFVNAYFTDTSEQLRMNERQILLLDNLPSGSALYRYDGKNINVIHINKRYWELVERDPKDYRDESVVSAIHPDDRYLVRDEIETAIRQNRNADANVRILCGQVGYKPFNIIAHIIGQTDGTYLLYTSYLPIKDNEVSLQEVLPVALSTVMSKSEELSYVKDVDLCYIICSDSFAKALGFNTARELVGKSDEDLFPPAFSASYLENDCRIMETHEAITDIVERMPTAKDGIRRIKTSKYPILDALGSVVGIYGISRDITLEYEKESQLELLTNNIPGGLATFVRLDNAIELAYCNSGFESLFGYDRKAFEGMQQGFLKRVVFAEDYATVIDNLDSLFNDGATNECSFRIHTKDGGYKWLSMRGTVSRNTHDEIVANTVILDITEQHLEEEALLIREEEYRLATEHSQRTICRYDIASRTLTIASDAATRYALPECIPDVPYGRVKLGVISEDTTKAYIDFYERIISGERENSVLFVKKLLNSWRWISAYSTTIFNKNGAPVSAIITYADVTTQQEKDVVYKKWLQSLDVRPIQSFTLFRCNLSKCASFDTMQGKLLDITFDNKLASFNERTAEYTEKRVFEDDREEYVKFVNSDRLLAEYYRGNRTATMDYREKTPDGGHRWLRLSIDLVEYPNSSDVEVYLMYENIDEQKKADILARKRSETDALTGIMNRTAFVERVNNILSVSTEKAYHALFMLDVDNFKQINDTFGHAKGDETLQNIANLLTANLRHGDLVGRIGGDEFLVFLRSIRDKQAAEIKANRICKVIYKDMGQDIVVSASIGIATYPLNGADFDTLYRKADAALYSVKGHGKNNCIFFTDDMLSPDMLSTTELINESEILPLNSDAVSTKPNRK